MTKKLILPVSLIAILAWAAGGQDAASVVSAATKALGSGDLKSIEYSGSGADYVLGQAGNPNVPWPRFVDKTYTRLIDLDAPASRMQRIRMQGENPLRRRPQPVVGEQNQTQVIAAGSPQAATLQDDLMMTLPYSFLKSAAAAKDATVKTQSMGGKKYTVLSFTGPNKAQVQGFLNSYNLPETLETKIDNMFSATSPSRPPFPITRISRA